MNSSKWIRQIMILALFALMAASAAGAETAGERYIVILKSRSGPAPDVARLGGTITFRQEDQLNVTLPREALPALRSDPLVRYVQAVADVKSFYELSSEQRKDVLTHRVIVARSHQKLQAIESFHTDIYLN